MVGIPGRPQDSWLIRGISPSGNTRRGAEPWYQEQEINGCSVLRGVDTTTTSGSVKGNQNAAFAFN
jgi:hypothetical protein